MRWISRELDEPVQALGHEVGKVAGGVKHEAWSIDGIRLWMESRRQVERGPFRLVMCWQSKGFSSLDALAPGHLIAARTLDDGEASTSFVAICSARA